MQSNKSPVLKRCFPLWKPFRKEKRTISTCGPSYAVNIPPPDIKVFWVFFLTANKPKSLILIWHTKALSSLCIRKLWTILSQWRELAALRSESPQYSGWTLSLSSFGLQTILLLAIKELENPSELPQRRNRSVGVFSALLPRCIWSS